MKVCIEMTGTSALLHHNPQLVDPNNKYAREIKSLTAKRKKTEEDLKRIEYLEWHGGLHTMIDAKGNEVVSQPTSKPRKAIIVAARKSKLGTAVEQSLYFTEVEVPLAYEGPKDIEKLHEDIRFHSRLSVGVNGKKRVMRVRPSFFPWSMTVNALFVEDAGINFDELVNAIELSGIICGIGDNRANGYGRYTVKVKEVK